MRFKPVFLAIGFCLCSVAMSFNTVKHSKSVEGTWVRKGDNLMVAIENGQASILKEGNEKFPCEVSDLPIYKDIRQVESNRWTCNFLVVTMGSCKTEYQAGELFISKQDELVIICPGFASKVYLKIKPRYNSTPN